MERTQHHYTTVTDRQWRLNGRFRGQTLIVNERGEYITDNAGEALTFPTAHDAEQWIERQWLADNGIKA